MTLQAWSAERLVSLGVMVLPVRRGEKGPPLVEWRPLQEMTVDDPRYRELFELWLARHWDVEEPANIAALGGRPSGNLAVLDFDSYDAYRRFFDPAKVERDTLVARSSRGVHVYFRTPEPLPCMRCPELGVDLKAHGGYVIAPFSLHPSGAMYVWVNPDVSNIAEVLDLEKMFARRTAALAAEAARSGEARARPVDVVPPCIRGIEERGVPMGMRNEAMIRYASYWLNARGLPVEEVWRRMLKANARFRPPLDERELRNVLRSAARHGYIYGCTGLSRLPFCDPARCRLARASARSFVRRLMGLPAGGPEPSGRPEDRLPMGGE